MSHRFFFPFLRIVLIAVTASTALPAAWAIGPKIPKGDVYLGYSRLGDNTFYPNVGGLNGLEGAASLKVGKLPFVSAEGDVSYYGFGASSVIPKTLTVLGGPRVSVGLLGAKVFAHGLIGVQDSNNSGGGVSISGGTFAYAVGGGLDVPIVPFFAWRVNGDYIDAPSLATQNATKFRVSTGLVFRF